MNVYLYAVVMIFGVLVAGTGLILLFLRKEQGENKIKLFGQEFQISTPALVVFLVGCAIFIIPLVLPIPNQKVLSFGNSDGGQQPINGTSATKTVTSATLIPTGQTVKGLLVTDKDINFFKFKTSAQELK